MRGHSTSVTVGSMTGSTIYAGIGNGSFPSTNSDFTSKSTISTLTVKGTYAGSYIAAANFKTLSIGPITYADNGNPFGVAALSIQQLKLLLNKRKITLRKVTTSSQVLGVFTSLGIAPQDLTFRILS